MPKRGSKEWKENIAKSLKGRDVWNKGLTKEDPRVAKYTSKNKALFKKGEHYSRKTEFKKGMIPHNLGKFHTDEVKRRIGLANKHPRPEIQGENHPNWKKDRNISYTQKHRIMRKAFEIITECQTCGGSDDLELSNISGKYLLDIKDWRKLCISCHKKFDKIVLNFKK